MTTDATSATTTEIDDAAFYEFLERFLGDLGATMHAATVLIRGPARAVPGHGRQPVAHVATGGRDQRHPPRYVREWLAAQAVSGYADYDPTTDRFRLTPVQALALTGRDTVLDAPGGLLAAATLFADLDVICDAFTTGRGLPWGEHHPDLTKATARFFGGNYLTNLVPRWIPTLHGAERRLCDGISVADIGCGAGATTILMAQANPASTFAGFDSDQRSIELARDAAGHAGVADQYRFEVATAKEYPGTGYGLVTVFDALHEMGDPPGAAAHVLETLDRDGPWMIVEPFAHDRLKDNHTPVGRVFYSASTTICLPMSRSQEVDAALEAQAGEARIREVVTAGGFTHFRRVTETPFNLVFEARP